MGKTGAWADDLPKVPGMRLLLHDPAYTDELATFLQSVGQRPVVSGPSHVEIGNIEADELEVYLRVWRVLYPDAEVEFAL